MFSIITNTRHFPVVPQCYYWPAYTKCRGHTSILVSAVVCRRL